VVTKSQNMVLKNLRELNNYTQEYVASVLDINQNSYYKLESGQTRLTVDRIKKLAELYNVPSEYFLYSELPFISYNTGTNSHSNMVIHPKSYIDVNNDFNSTSDMKMKEIYEKLIEEKDRQIRQYQVELLEEKKERKQLLMLIEKLSNSI
jgi:transcriptional regulator with XRE-family HTH domain